MRARAARAGPATDAANGFDTDADGRVARVRAGLWPWTAHAAYCDDEAPRAAATGWPLG